jgi:putative IMPACT (imprinted ancient) family translation regulator
MADWYMTVENESSDEFVEKKSRFIGYVKPVKTEEEAIEFVNKIKSKHSDARHNPYAYIVSCDGVTNQRYSDDGEPQGTAGMPILEVIRSVGYENDSYFHREYKSKTGMSPLARRRLSRKSKL